MQQRHLKVRMMITKNNIIIYYKLSLQMYMCKCFKKLCMYKMILFIWSLISFVLNSKIVTVAGGIESSVFG